MRWSAAIPVMLLCTASVLVPAVAPTPVFAEDRALIIGIDKYPHWPDTVQLTAAANDARLYRRVAREVWRFNSGQIKLLLDEGATGRAILDAFETWLIEGTRAGDRVLITYSGHGYFEADMDGDEPDGWDETVVPSDARLEGGGITGMISDDVFARLLDRLEGRDVMMIIDSCHSGTITRALDPRMRKGLSITRSIASPRVTRGLSHDSYEAHRSSKAFIEPRPHLMAWTAVSASEKAQEDVSAPRDLRNGVFTRAFAGGLLERRADMGGNGVVSAAELLAFTREEAVRYCQREVCETGMTPTLEAPAKHLARNVRDWRPIGQSAPAVALPAEPSPPPVPLVQVAADDIIAQDNALGVKLEILPRADVRMGDEIKVRVISPKPGYLVLLDVRESGEVRQLFPSNCARKERRLRANAPLTMPDPTYGCVFEADEAGKGQLLAIITEDNVTLEDLLQRNRDLQVVPDGDAYLAALAQRLLAVWTGDERNRPVRWALAKVGYEVGN